MIASVEPGDDWAYCYVDDELLPPADRVDQLA